jgi:hypothetical protein
MNITRRDVLRRLAGVATAASIWVSTKFVLDDEIPSVVAGRQTALNGRRNNSQGQGRQSTTAGANATAGTPPPTSSNTSATSDSASTTGHQHETNSDQESTSTTSEGTSSTQEDSTTAAPQSGETILTGSLGEHVVPEGETHRLRGQVSFSGPLHVQGTLTCDDSGVEVDMRGNEISSHGGGRILLEGLAKSGWTRWGESVSGWKSGDRLAIAPTASGNFTPLNGSWSGGWGGAPGDARGVTLEDGRTVQAEVANLTRSVVIRNASRLMMHQSDRAVSHRIRHVAFVDCGIADNLGFYPVHFHLNGSNTRGSLVEGVVVEGGRNHAFVPHGSHGITFRDCVAVRTLNDAYWWDPPAGNTANNSNDIMYDHCLALDVSPAPSGVGKHRLSGFHLGSGRDGSNTARDCVAAGIRGGADASGFFWPEKAGAVWNFQDCVAHNNQAHGIFVWQNTSTYHLIDLFTGYGNRTVDVAHGAYRNRYDYRRLTVGSVEVNAVSKDGETAQRWTDSAIGVFISAHHNPTQTAQQPTVIERCRIGQIVYAEDGGPSVSRFVDCGVAPDKFDLRQIHPDTLIETVEGGEIKHLWAAGSWA